MSFEITPDILLRAYAAGLFPMAEDAEDSGLFWVEPKRRGVLPLDKFHVSSSLARLIRRNEWQIAIDKDFDAVIESCAAATPGREKTWINRRIRALYGELFTLKHCHTVEVYEDETLIGGLYGVKLNGAFFGESMFHKRRDASKVALVHLAALLKANGFGLLDTQFVTPHLAQFGATEVPRRAYLKLLEAALNLEASWPSQPLSGPEALGVLKD